MPNLILVRNEYQDYRALRRVLTYVLRSNLYGGYGIDPSRAYEQMVFVKEAYHKKSGVQLKHFFLTFSDQEMIYLSFQDILNIGFEIGKYFAEYQMVYGIHLDSNHTHLHVVMNSVSFQNGYKYSDGLSKFNGLCRYLRERFPRFEVHLFQSGHYSADDPYTSEKKGIYQILE